MATTIFDYITVGGGLTGCVIAHRLQAQGHSVVLFEAGPDPSDNKNFPGLLGAFVMTGSELDYSYKTVPQASTYDRVHVIGAGKALGGGTAINYGGWLRGDSDDYNAWADLVKDDRWSYAGLLPWCRKVETFFDADVDPQAHSFDGPMHVTSISGRNEGRQYPLRDPIRSAWQELGIGFNPDHDSGSGSGLSEFHENSRDAKRQALFRAYSLEGTEIMTSTTVSKVAFDDGVATGVQLIDGRHFSARKEVILAAGAYGTPQLLMLSGIGPQFTPEKHNIPLIHASPAVGENLHDHFAIYLSFRLKDSDRCLALEKFQNPAFFTGMPVD